MSFDPQNPRGSPGPSTPPPTPDSPKPGSFIPPQPVGSGSGLPRGLLLGAVVVAIAVLVIILFALANSGGDHPSTPPPASPAASPAVPTIASSSSSSRVPTPVSSMPTQTFTPAQSAPSGYDGFLLHVPEALRGTCEPGESSDSSILFSAQCTSSDGIVVTYDQYADSTSMDAAYQSAFAAQQIDPGTGSCEDHGTWPAESAYQVAGQPAGRRLCIDVQGSPTVLWTDERVTIYSNATGTDPVRLIQFWTNEAGPIQ